MKIQEAISDVVESESLWTGENGSWMGPKKGKKVGFTIGSPSLFQPGERGTQNLGGTIVWSPPEEDGGSE